MILRSMFALAAVREHCARLGRTSRRYMAPELFLDDGEYSFPADVFAYGVFLFEILTGRTIFTMEEIRSMSAGCTVR